MVGHYFYTYMHMQSGFLSSRIACSDLLTAAARPHPRCARPVATLSGDPSPTMGYHRGDVISFAMTVLAGDEITCSHETLLM